MDTPIDRNILAMNDFRADSGYGAIAQVESYWEGLRGNRLVPKRSEIDPRGIEMALELSFVLERIAPGMARLRIAGSHLGDLMGMEVRGMPLTSFITPNGRRALGDTLEEVFQRPAICELELTGEGGFGKPDLEARMILLPLKSDLGDISRVLGCLVSKGDMGKKPRRFDITKTTMRAIEAPATVPTPIHVIEAETLGQQLAGLAEDAAVFKQRTSTPEKPYLRLVKNED
ncbi:MAG: hypothetical protein ACI9PY_002131 [Ascidiaceihabitans sp.]|jgi:hypothetical protein